MAVSDLVQHAAVHCWISLCARRQQCRKAREYSKSAEVKKVRRDFEIGGSYTASVDVPLARR